MRVYVIRRLLLFIPTLFLVSVVIFVVMRIIPGDPALAYFGEGEFTQEDYLRLKSKMGLDKPLVVQYAEWVGNMFRLDFGSSLRNNLSVLDTIKSRVPVTMELAFLAIAIAVSVAVPIGVVCALRQDTGADYILRVLAIIGITLPAFWLGTMVVIVMSRYFGWMPPLEYAMLWLKPSVNLSQMIWPALVLGFHLTGITSRMTRAQMLEVMRQDYIRTAWSKGLRERTVVARHGLKNACLPVITLVGMQLGHLLGGAIVTEQIFLIPGMGRLFIESAFSRDWPVIQAVVIFFAFVYLVMNLIVDLAYGWLDPRIRFQ